MKTKSYFYLIFLVFLISCSGLSEPQIEKGRISLTAENVTASFVRLKLEIASEQSFDGFAVYRGDSLVRKSLITGRDTVFYDGGLQPNTNYEYKAALLKNDKEIDTSIKVQALTTNTSSRNFVWEVDTIGVFPSILWDITVIDTNEVWAVGDIDTMDYPQSDQFNAVKWNGSSFEYHKVLLKDYGGNLRIQPLSVAMSFSDDDIWFFSSSASYVRWNGFEWYTEFFPEQKGSPKDAWGFSSSDFYIVGNNGSITHFNGSNFTLMESGTDFDLFEVKGYIDPDTGKKTVWAMGFGTTEFVLLQLVNGVWKSVWDKEKLQFSDGFTYPLTLYFPDNKSVFMTFWNGRSARLYCFDQNDLSNHILLAEHTGYPYDMSANSMNDIIMSGSFNNIEHYNGHSFYRYDELFGGGRFFEIEMFIDNIFAAGDVSQLGIFLRGKRQ